MTFGSLHHIMMVEDPDTLNTFSVLVQSQDCQSVGASMRQHQEQLAMM